MLIKKNMIFASISAREKTLHSNVVVFFKIIIIQCLSLLLFFLSCNDLYD